MDAPVESKIYAIAQQLDELNDRGMVKGFVGNEKGYAKVIQIKVGCSIWVHHLKDDNLIIDLMVSKSSAERYPEATKRAVERFKDFINFMTDSVSWQHSVNMNNNAQRYYVDVTDMPLGQITRILDKLKAEFLK